MATKIDQVAEILQSIGVSYVESYRTARLIDAVYPTETKIARVLTEAEVEAKVVASELSRLANRGDQQK